MCWKRDINDDINRAPVIDKHNYKYIFSKGKYSELEYRTDIDDIVLLANSSFYIFLFHRIVGLAAPSQKLNFIVSKMGSTRLNMNPYLSQYILLKTPFVSILPRNISLIRVLVLPLISRLFIMKIQEKIL